MKIILTWETSSRWRSSNRTSSDPCCCWFIVRPFFYGGTYFFKSRFRRLRLIFSWQINHTFPQMLGFYFLWKGENEWSLRAKKGILSFDVIFFLQGIKNQPPPHVRQGGGVNLQKICPFGDFSFFDPPLSFSQNLIYQNVDFKNIFIPGYRSSRIVNSYTRYFFAILWKSEIWNNIFLNFNSDGQFR